MATTDEEDGEIPLAFVSACSMARREPWSWCRALFGGEVHQLFALATVLGVEASSFAWMVGNDTLAYWWA
jgi:hypothetical protein